MAERVGRRLWVERKGLGVSEVGHIPVLLKETVAALGVKEGGRYLDGTFGRGGHSREIVRRGGMVLGIDRDDDAVAAGKKVVNMQY